MQSGTLVIPEVVVLLPGVSRMFKRAESCNGLFSGCDHAVAIR